MRQDPDEISMISTRQLRGAFWPRQFKRLTEVTLTSGRHSTKVKIERIPGRGVTPFLTCFVCPQCGKATQKLACIRGEWGCRKCVPLRNCGQEVSTIPYAEVSSEDPSVIKKIHGMKIVDLGRMASAIRS